MSNLNVSEKCSMNDVLFLNFQRSFVMSTSKTQFLLFYFRGICISMNLLFEPLKLEFQLNSEWCTTLFTWIEAEEHISEAAGTTSDVAFEDTGLSFFSLYHTETFRLKTVKKNIQFGESWDLLEKSFGSLFYYYFSRGNCLLLHTVWRSQRLIFKGKPMEQHVLKLSNPKVWTLSLCWDVYKNVQWGNIFAYQGCIYLAKKYIKMYYDVKLLLCF